MKDDQNKTIKTILRDDSGATLFIALLFFIICAACGAVILVAGTQAAGRMSGLTENEQNLYAATSAAKLIKDEINGRTVTITIVDGGEPEYSQETVPASDLYKNRTGLLYELISQAYTKINQNANDGSKAYETEKNISVSGNDTLNADVDLTVYTDYHILATCSAGDDDNKVTAYAILYAGTQKNETQDDSGKTTVTYTITYSGGYVSSRQPEDSSQTEADNANATTTQE